MVLGATRVIAIAAGCFSGAAGSLEYGPFFLIVPAVLVLGAIIQPWSTRPGRWLMWLGAFFLTLYEGAFFVPQIAEVITSQFASLDSVAIQVLFLLTLVSVFLIIWCDAALVVDARRSKRALGTTEPNYPIVADYVVWGAALCLSVLTGWGIIASLFPFLHYDRWDIFVVALVFGLAVAMLDVALVIHAVRQRHRPSRLDRTAGLSA